jgi:streptomycin 3"-adenylyltransferase
MPYHWRHCPDDVRSLVNRVLEDYHAILADNLVGFYLHGSLAMGCFNPELSDIDFLAVVSRPMTSEEKSAVIRSMLEAHGRIAGNGIEMSIVRADEVSALPYPTPYELHYSDDHYEAYRRGEVEPSGPLYDEDLVAHFAITRKAGICLYGRPVAEVFPEVPRELYIKSLLQDARWIGTVMEEHPLYAVLNLCRFIAYLQEDAIMSKAEGAVWGLANLLKEFSPLISLARDIYAGGAGDARLDMPAVREFVGWATRRVNKLAEDAAAP